MVAGSLRFLRLTNGFDWKVILVTEKVMEGIDFVGRYYETLSLLTSAISERQRGDQSGSSECFLGSGHKIRVRIPPG